jgi:hypothetical protein
MKEESPRDAALAGVAMLLALPTLYIILAIFVEYLK